jgi:hypothetical protein
LNIKIPRPEIVLTSVLSVLTCAFPALFQVGSLFPPWSLILPACDFSLSGHVRGQTSMLTYRRLFSYLISPYSDYTTVYVDWSFVQG